MSIRSSRLMVSSNTKINDNVYEMTLVGDDFSQVKYGQFVNILIPGFSLRRPFSVADFSDEKILITYRVVGDGTRVLSSYERGDQLDVLFGLGNGFESVEDKKVTLIGGGIGVVSLYGWYKYLIKNGYNVEVILGFKSPQEAIYLEKFRKPEVVYDIDGVNLIDHLSTRQKPLAYYYACGPMGLLKRLATNYDNGQLLLEERMGCGFGACMGCSYKTNNNKYKRVCVEGPMFYANEVAE